MKHRGGLSRGTEDLGGLSADLITLLMTEMLSLPLSEQLDLTEYILRRGLYNTFATWESPHLLPVPLLPPFPCDPLISSKEALASIAVVPTNQPSEALGHRAGG